MSSPTHEKRFEISTFVNFVYGLDISDAHLLEVNLKRMMNEQEKAIHEAIKYLPQSHHKTPSWKILHGNYKGLTTQIDICRTELWDSKEEDEENPIIRI